MYQSILAIFFLLLATIVAVPWLQVDKEIPLYAEREGVRPLLTTPSVALQHATSSYDPGRGNYIWGRTLRPSYAMQLHPLNTVQTYTQKKEFLWLGLTAGPWFVGLAILQFNYISILTVNLYNVELEESWKAMDKVPFLAPWFGGRWVPNAKGDMGPTAAGHWVEFTSPFSSQRANVSFEERGIRVDITGTVWRRVAVNNSTTVSRPYDVHAVAALPEEFLGVVFPLGPRRAAVVAKVAAASLREEVRLRVNGREWRGRGHFAMDYTRGLLRRETHWHWACATAPAGHGFHLSEGTYDVDGKSVENTFFAGGRAVLLDVRVEFRRVTAAANATTHTAAEVWTITGDGIQLRFHRADAHDGTFHFGIVDGNLDHAWGVIDGTMLVNGTTYKFDKVAGVLEDHYALW